MRKTFPVSILLCCILLSACTAAPPQQTAAPIPTNTLSPTSMPTPTATLEPTSTPTLTPSPTATPSQDLVSEAEGDYLIYKIRNKLTFYDPAKDLHVPILPDWEISTYTISSNNVLAFSSEHDGYRDIYLLDYPYTENEPRNITDELNTDNWVLDWSPDGQLLAFQSRISDDQKMLSIWDGKSISHIYEYKVHLGEYAWSKDGRLAFTEFYGFAGEVQPAEIFLWDGKTVYSISQNPSGEDGNPAWNQNGQLAFNSVQEGKYNIFVWDGTTTINGLPDKKTFKNIAPEIPGYYYDPVWTSSGTISFSGAEGHYAQIYEWDGKKVTEISNNPNFPNVGQSWSKNGFWAFTTSYYSNEHKLYIRDQQNQTVLETPGLFPPAWSDEGYLMYCIYNQTADSSTWTLAIWDGENIHSVIEDNAYIWASWPNGEDVYCSLI
jgi:WD40-like Beta Propeller Repeat